MAKFTLIIWVCSFLGSQSACLPPVEYPKKLDSWYECSRTAHQESLVLISKMGFKYINDNKVAIKYSCVEGTAI
tara:strand:+ start:292 stop:513 length:222 start_codon:yes stop_codon:yes gene_type:complete